MYNIILTNGEIINVNATRIEWCEESRMIRLINDKKIVARINMDSIVGWVDANYNYISRVQAIEEINKYHMTSGVSNQGTWNECVDVIAHTVSDLPSADVRENKTGEWIEGRYRSVDQTGETYDDGEAVICSVCRHAFKEQFLWSRNFCPNCGADMRGE